MTVADDRPTAPPAAPAATVSVDLQVNGVEHRLEVTVDDTLADLLRDRLALTGCRETCGLGVCGSCTVLLDDRPVSACLLPAFALDGRTVRTVEGLADDGGLHLVQQAFVEEQAFQCSFCTPGLVMTATALVEESGGPGGGDGPPLEEALAGHLCRCGTYGQILAAVRRAVASAAPNGPGSTRREPGGDPVVP